MILLGGEDVSLRQMLSDIAAMVGRKAPTVNLPRAPLYTRGSAVRRRGSLEQGQLRAGRRGWVWKD